MSDTATQEQATPAEKETTENFNVFTSDRPVIDVKPEKDDKQEEQTKETAESEPEKKATEGDDKASKKPESKDVEAKDDESKKTEEDPKAPAPEPNDGLVKANKRLKNQRTQLRDENAQLRARVKELEADHEADSDEPDEDDFESWEEYEAAKKAHAKKTKQASKKEKSEADTAETKKELSPEQQQYMDDFEEATDVVFGALSKEAAKKVIEDQTLAFTPDLVIAIADTEAPGPITEYLADNPEMLMEIAKLKPLKQARRIAKLEIQLANKKPADKKTEPAKSTAKKQTQAPEPIVPESGSSIQKKTASEQSYSEFEAERNEKEKRARTSFW